MIKDKRLEAIKELKEEFKAADKSTYNLSSLYQLLETDHLPHVAELYEVNNSSYSKSIINGWTSHSEESKYYNFNIELIKKVNDKVVSEFIKIEHDKKDLLIKLYEILK